jgi:hypothetical protein
MDRSWSRRQKVFIQLFLASGTRRRHRGKPGMRSARSVDKKKTG